MVEFNVFQGNCNPHEVEAWPPAPPWRRSDAPAITRTIAPETRGDTFRARSELVELVNAAIHLRRPLLITGKPGTGKSSLAYAIAHELMLGRLLVWPINSRSTLQQGLYHYDAIARLQEASLLQQRAAAPVRDESLAPEGAALSIGRFVRLGPLGTALLPAQRPRVLLIDEIDKSDVDLPNDLLHVLEEGVFDIPELARASSRVVNVRPVAGDGEDDIPIEQGKIRCQEFPIVVLTSNGEREFPGAFKRRCIRVEMPDPTEEELVAIVKAHFHDDDQAIARSPALIRAFLSKRNEGGDMATDQLLNAVRLAMSGADLSDGANGLLNAVLRPLSGT